MKTRSGLSLFFALTVVALAGLSCSDRSPVSPGSMEGNGLVKLDLRLSKMSEQAIDRVLVEAKNPPMEPVSGELAITGKTATGSLEVFPGKWVIVVKAYTGSTLCYHGEIGPVDVVAGKSTDIPSMKLHATRDLVADRIFIADTDWNELVRVEEGQEVLLVLVYKNTGSAEAAGWREQAFLDGAERGHTNDMAVGAGQTKRIGQNWTAVAGTHTVEFRLDTENVIGESDESNNTISLTFTIQPPVDLVAEEVYIRWSETKDRLDPKNLVAGSVVDLVLSCRNAGSTDAAGWRFEAYLDEVLLCSMDDVSIPAGNEWLLWCPDWTATEGPHRIELRLDTGNVIREKDETNNTARLTFTVLQPAPEVDLVAEEVFVTRAGEYERIDPNNFVEGDEVDLNLTYRNAGTMDATGWHIEVYVDGIPAGSDVRSIEANSTDAVWLTWTATEGTHTVEFRLDTEDIINEKDETNNKATLTFTVSANPWKDTDGDGFFDSEDLFPLGNAKIQVALRKFGVYVDNGLWEATSEIFFKIEVDGVTLVAPREGYYWECDNGESVEPNWSSREVDVADNSRYHNVIIQMWDTDTLADDLYDIDADETKSLNLRYDLKTGAWAGDDTDGVTYGDEGYLEYEIKTVVE